MKVRKTDRECTRGIILDTLFYEIYMATKPCDPEWAARALEALIDAGLLDREETDEIERQYCRIKGELFARKEAQGGGQGRK